MNDFLTPKEKGARSEYYKAWRNQNPERSKAIQIRYWETRAAKHYGLKYNGPGENGELSEQAREIRKEYYADLRKKNPGQSQKSQKDFWSRKACQKGGTNAT